MLEILLVDDEPATRISVACALYEAGHRVTEAGDGAEAIALTTDAVFDVAICDVRLPKVDGLTLFRHLRRESPGTAVILMTAYATVSDAVMALREGAFDYVTKPFDCEEFSLRVIGRIAERRALRAELEQARAELVGREVGSLIVGHSPAMARLLERIDTIAQSDAHVLITGETGTGKELVARTLHARSARRGGPFVAVNCAAFNEAALEHELFGGERGGALKPGRLGAAHGGTILLDEVAELPLAVQARLLRVINDGVLEPVGIDAPSKVDVRVMSATHVDLRDRVTAGLFREDLLLAIKVLDIAIPPLRERKGDLPLLLQYFMKRLSPPGMVPPGIAPRAWSALAEYAWPGNVREFSHAIERALVLAHGSEIDVEHLPPDVLARDAAHELDAERVRPLAVAMKEYERHYLLKVLHVAGARRGRAAELLGISRKNLWEKLRQHGISGSDLDDEPALPESGVASEARRRTSSR
jgi:DNA-binding NtrC family response regulator